MPPRRSRLVAALGALLIATTTTGCIGAVDRADFEKDLRARGGGLVSALPAAAIDALRQRLGVTDFQATVILLTAPNSGRFSITTLDQPPQLTRYFNENQDLAGQDTAIRFRIRVPDHPEQQDDYTYANGTLHGPTPVHVSAADHPDDETFDIRAVTGLQRLEDIIDTARTRTGIHDGYVSAIVANRAGPDLRITVNVTSPRTTAIAQFDGAGTFLRMQQA